MSLFSFGSQSSCLSDGQKCLWVWTICTVILKLKVTEGILRGALIQSALEGTCLTLCLTVPQWTLGLTLPSLGHKAHRALFGHKQSLLLISHSKPTSELYPCHSPGVGAKCSHGVPESTELTQAKIQFMSLLAFTSGLFIPQNMSSRDISMDPVHPRPHLFCSGFLTSLF